jgi:hypothetical protein
MFHLALFSLLCHAERATLPVLVSYPLVVLTQPSLHLTRDMGQAGMDSGWGQIQAQEKGQGQE